MSRAIQRSHGSIGGFNPPGLYFLFDIFSIEVFWWKKRLKSRFFDFRNKSGRNLRPEWTNTSWRTMIFFLWFNDARRGSNSSRKNPRWIMLFELDSTSNQTPRSVFPRGKFFSSRNQTPRIDNPRGIYFEQFGSEWNFFFLEEAAPRWKIPEESTSSNWIFSRIKKRKFSLFEEFLFPRRKNSSYRFQQVHWIVKNLLMRY